MLIYLASFLILIAGTYIGYKFRAEIYKFIHKKELLEKETLKEKQRLYRIELKKRKENDKTKTTNA